MFRHAALDHDISQSFDHLSQSQAIGDINGDGVPDLLISGNSHNYILFGPVNLNDVSSIDSQAAGTWMKMMR